MSLEARLREIKERADKATPGPWVYRPECYGVMVEGQDVTICSGSPRDEEFIAKARTDVPELISYCEILARAVKATEDWYTHTATCQECGRCGRYCALALDLLRDAGDAHRAAVKLLETGEMPK